MNAVAQPTVLVLDDDEFSRDLACIALGSLGFTQVQTASDGRDGLRAFDDMPQPPDFLICDVFMPDKDGIECVAELAARGYRGGLILVSGGDAHMLSLARQIAVESGLNVLGVFTKPLQQRALHQALSERAST